MIKANLAQWIVDLLRFGRLTIVGRADPRKGQSYMICRCDCGTEKEIALSSLRTGRSKSCGCYQKETGPPNKRHGLSESRAYSIWLGMRQRCGNPSSPAYKNYGGRGIAIDPRWECFEMFHADMGDPPEGMTLERKDNDRCYGPENCYWADRLTQNRNTRRCVRLSFKGETKTLGEWANQYGIKRQTLAQRLRNGWPMERALTESPLLYHGRSTAPLTT